MTDAISLSYERTAAHLGLLRGALYGIEARRLIRFERELIDRCDLTVLVSAVDRDFLVQGEKSNKSMVCSNGVDSDRFRFDYAPDGQTLVFIGKNFAFYNVDAILYFAEVVLPLVRSQFPKTKFKVIGQIGNGLRRRLEKQDVAVTGAVDDIGFTAHGATIGVCPLRVGAGVQNKILEYMSLGIPVVTSKVGLEGLDAIPDKHLLVAEQPAEWAVQISRLLSSPELRSDLAHHGRSFVEEKHAWAALVAPLSDRIFKLVEAKRRDQADASANQGSSLP
ncbi:glycosyltransferase family 4 protein [Occallatibacter riparius]|uniref:Glycosyltransferase family 4 protein n=1 Tax=Occallatibacter riparius TaxID=1002689 RepID=A0A9J7BRT0_9BACT|nr:glycosyltransferase family 4 protein [Occallatibacter riparius]UWZ85563.1 glycosyltransferase family 4 protein [Occallatibacter riparius]